MISQQESRERYIGGSDANMVYMNYDTQSFKNWWSYKITGIKLFELKGMHITLGNIIEDYVLDHIGLDRKYRGVKKMHPELKYVGCNTDGLEEDPIILHEVKKMMPQKAQKIMLGSKLPIAYRRQVGHSIWVTGAEKAKIHMLEIDEEGEYNPWGIDMGSNLYTIEMGQELDIEEHKRRILYLTDCFDNGITPTNEGLELY